MTCKPLDDETRERLQAGWPEEGQATPAHILETQIMHLRIPKNEREWWARREIELLRDKVEALQSCACADCNREILELRAEVEALQQKLAGVLNDNRKLFDLYTSQSTEIVSLHKLLDRITTTYAAYRRRGVGPASTEYADVVAAIENAALSAGRVE